jgi:hypothetical protein
MDKWIAKAAGGTSQRLNWGCAVILSFEKKADIFFP